jgi:hypothetical protein
MLDTVKGWASQWWFWVIIGLAVLSVVLFIWAVAVSASLTKANTTLAAARKKYSFVDADLAAASTYRRRQQRYMPDPGIPAKKMLYGKTGRDMSGYKNGSDPDVILKNALRQ